MDLMFNRKTNSQVEVYAIDVDHNTAMFYDSKLASTNGGNGWQKCPMKWLIPLEYVNNGEYVSKTERNSVKSKLQLVDAVWQCTDGLCFTHKNLEGAIAHQRDLMKEEK